MPAPVEMSAYREFMGFIDEAVEADLPLDQKHKNLTDLTEEIEADDTLSEEERTDLKGLLRKGLATAGRTI